MTAPDGPPTPDPWDGLLDPGERVLWQGQPDGRWAFEGQMGCAVPFGLFFAGFSVVWMGLAAQAPFPFWLFGLPFFAIGVGLVATSLFGSTWMRRRTTYTITDRRVLIGEDGRLPPALARLGLPSAGRSLTSVRIEPDFPIALSERGHLADITVGRSTARDADGDRTTTDVALRRIEDGREVFALLRAVQRGESP
ncbi:MAG: hypothetical protein ACU0CO_17710 [Shimia sp.]